MKILILIGMVIVFISAFFILFIFDTLIKPQTACFINPEHPSCDTSADTGMLLIGLMMIGLFIIVDIVTIYITVTTAMSETTA